MSVFDADFAAADGLLAEAFGEQATYLVGNSTIPVTAEVVMRDYQVDDADGILTTVQSRDYLIDAAALGIDPKPGHRIQQTIAGKVHTFELLPLGKRPAAEWADPNKTRWLIHTKLTGTA